MTKEMVSYKDGELLVLMCVLDELWKLREDREACIRVLRYVAARMDLPLLVLNTKPERCEEIEPGIFIG